MVPANIKCLGFGPCKIVVFGFTPCKYRIFCFDHYCFVSVRVKSIHIKSIQLICILKEPNPMWINFTRTKTKQQGSKTKNRYWQGLKPIILKHLIFEGTICIFKPTNYLIINEWITLLILKQCITYQVSMG